MDKEKKIEKKRYLHSGEWIWIYVFIIIDRERLNEFIWMDHNVYEYEMILNDYNDMSLDYYYNHNKTFNSISLVLLVLYCTY